MLTCSLFTRCSGHELEQTHSGGRRIHEEICLYRPPVLLEDASNVQTNKIQHSTESPVGNIEPSFYFEI